MTEKITYEKVADHLAHVVPEFTPTIREHVADYEEVLQHLLFGDLTRFVLAAWEAGDKEVVSRCLSFLEEASVNGDADVKNLVAVSFVENVGPWEKENARFIRTWPPHLQAEAQRQGWKG